MRFDPDFAPPVSGLPATLARNIEETRAARRRAGLNVQFIRETDGRLDEFSFGDAARRDAFVSSLERRGVPYAISE